MLFFFFFFRDIEWYMVMCFSQKATLKQTLHILFFEGTLWICSSILSPSSGNWWSSSPWTIRYSSYFIITVILCVFLLVNKSHEKRKFVLTSPVCVDKAWCILFLWASALRCCSETIKNGLKNHTVDGCSFIMMDTTSVVHFELIPNTAHRTAAENTN